MDQIPISQPSVQQKGAKINPWVVVGILLIAFIVDGGIYAWQQSKLESVKFDFQSQIDLLKNDVTSLEIESEKNYDDITGSTVSNTSNTDTTSSIVVDGGGFNVEGLNIEVIYPKTYTVAKNDEKNRRGSLISYDFGTSPTTSSPILGEILFYTEQTVKNFNEYCKSIDYPCFFGVYPSEQDFKVQKTAVENNKTVGDYTGIVINQQYYLSKTFPVQGDSGLLKEYISYIGTTRIEVNVFILTDDMSEKADELMKGVFLKAIN